MISGNQIDDFGKDLCDRHENSSKRAGALTHDPVPELFCPELPQIEAAPAAQPELTGERFVRKAPRRASWNQEFRCKVMPPKVSAAPSLRRSAPKPA